MEPAPQTQPRKYLKEGMLVLLVIVLAFSFFTPRSVEYSDHRFIRFIPGIINLIAVPVLVVVALVLHKSVFKRYFIVYGILAVMVASTLTSFIHYSAKANDLRANGVWGKAVVIDRKIIVRTVDVLQQIKCSFIVNGRRVETLYERDFKYTYKKGDTLGILYDKDFPRIYQLKQVH